ncbi:hypothetical protein [Aeromonas salmonicida]
MKTKRQHLFAGVFLLPDMSFSNAFLIITDKDNPVGRMKEELEAHTEQVWKYQPLFDFDIDPKNGKQLTAMNRMIATIETKNSIPEDEFEFIRFE